MIKKLESKLQDEAAMRAFYESVGISKATIEAAIKARRSQPVECEKKPSPLKGKKRKAVV